MIALCATIRRHPVRLPHHFAEDSPRLWISLVCVCMLLPLVLLGCGGSHSNGPSGDSVEEPLERDLSNEHILVVEECEELLNVLRASDVDTMGEEQLMELMTEAVQVYPECSALYVEVATTPVERVLFGHRADQIELYALLIELELSREYDDGAGSCAILGDAFTLLMENIASIDAVLEKTGLTPGEIRQLHELRQLDLQAVDVLYVSFENVCQ